MSQLGASSGFLGDGLSQSQAGGAADASQRTGNGADDGLQSQGEFGFYGYASQGSQMDFDFKEGSASSQTSDWAQSMPGQLHDVDGITGQFAPRASNLAAACAFAARSLVLCSG
jgi:hypothetical protein